MRRLARWIELASGVTAAILGIVAIVYFLIAPIGTLATETTGPIRTSYQAAHVSIQPTAMISFSILVLILVGIGIGALLHSRFGARTWQVLLWFAAAYLVVFTVLGMFTIGLYLLPSVALAIIACILSLLVRNGGFTRH